MSKFKVGDRVRAVDETAILVKGREYTVVAPRAIGPAHHVFVNTGSNGVLNYTDDFFELVEPVAVAPATATLNIEAGKFYKTRDGRKVGPMVPTREVWTDLEGDTSAFDDESGHYYTAAGLFLTRYGAPDDNDLVAEWVDEPVEPAADTTPLHITLGIDMNPPRAPQVGDSVLIPGWITSITQGSKVTNYSIAFETQNRRVSLHFLEEDFIVDPDSDDDGGCPCATNDNGPLPYGGDTAKAFDAIGSWLNSLAVRRAA